MTFHMLGCITRACLCGFLPNNPKQSQTIPTMHRSGGELMPGDRNPFHKQGQRLDHHDLEAGSPTPRHDHTARCLEGGLLLGGQELRECMVKWVGPDRLMLLLRQGKKRQIRRMLALVGLRVRSLRRTRVGGLSLDDIGLPEGQWTYVAPHSIL